jgi:hypothetical protein
MPARGWRAAHRFKPAAGTGPEASKDLLSLTAASGVYSPVHRTSDISAEDFEHRHAGRAACGNAVS